MRKIAGAVLAFLFLWTVRAAAVTTANFPFDVDANYVYDPARIQVAGGIAQLQTPPDWWDLNWPYRLPIRIQNPHAGPSYLIVDIEIDHLVTDFWSIMNGQDGTDIRFALPNGNLLRFTRLEFQSTPHGAEYARFRVRLDPAVLGGPIPAGNILIYLYFGNFGAPDASEPLLQLTSPGAYPFMLPFGGVDDPIFNGFPQYFGDVDYVYGFFAENLWPQPDPSDNIWAIPDFPNTPLPLPPEPRGHELVYQIDVTPWFPNGFPFYGQWVETVYPHTNGCLGMGAPPNCTFDKLTQLEWQSWLPQSPRIDVYAQDQEQSSRFDDPDSRCGVDETDPMNPEPLLEGIYYNEEDLGVQFDLRVRWCGEAMSGGLNQFMVRLYPGGFIQYDYGYQITTSYQPDRPLPFECDYVCGPVVGISAGDGKRFLVIQEYNRVPPWQPLRKDPNDPTVTPSVLVIPYMLLLDASSFLPRQGRYDSTQPDIQNVSAPPFASIVDFQQTYGTPPGTEIRYALSPDGTNWYYWDGNQWKPSDLSYFQTTPADLMPEAAPQFPHQGALYWKAFLISDGAETPFLDELTFTLSPARPDALIRYGSQAFLGDGVYNATGNQQSIALEVLPFQTYDFTLRIQNDGLVDDDFQVVLTIPPPTGWNLQILDGTTDVTAAVLSGTYQTGLLPPGAFKELRIRYAPDLFALGGELLQQPFVAISTAETGALVQDVVLLRLTPRVTHGVDVQVGLQPDLSDAVGDGVYEEDGATQLQRTSVPNGTPAVFYILIENESNIQERLTLRQIGGVPEGWTIEYLDPADNPIPLADLTGDGFELNIGRGETFLLRQIITPGPNVEGQSTTGQLVFQVTGSQAPDLVDAVRTEVLVTLSRQPDLWIGLLPDGSDALGNDVYNTDATGQTATQVAPLSATFYLRLQNDGNASADILLSAAECNGLGNFQAVITDAASGEDYSAEILSGGKVFLLPPAGVKVFRITLTVDPSLTMGETRSLCFLATDTAGGEQDAATAILEVGGLYQPDLLYSDRTDLPFQGARDFSAVQVIRMPTGIGVPRVYYLQAINLGNTTDDLLLTALPPAGPWEVRFFDAFQGGTDITDAVLGPGHAFTGVAIGEARQFRAEITPLPGANLGDVVDIPVTLTSVGNAARQDQVTLSVRVGFVVDGLISRWPDRSQPCPANPIGESVISPTGEGEQVVGEAYLGNPAWFCVTFRNMGYPTQIRLEGGQDPSGQWSVRYFLINPDLSLQEITALFDAGGFVTQNVLATGDEIQLAVAIQPNILLPEGEQFSVSVTGRSAERAETVDAVIPTAEFRIPGAAFYGVDLVIEGRGKDTTALPGTGGGGQAQKTVVEGSTFQVPLELRNIGNQDDTYTLQWTAPSNWIVHLFVGNNQYTSPPVQVSVPLSQGTQLMTLSVQVPANATSGQIILDAISQANPQATDSVRADVTVVPAEYGVDALINGNGQLEFGAQGSGQGGTATVITTPGSEIIANLDILNIGNKDSVYSVSWSSVTGWNVWLVDPQTNQLFTTPFQTPPIAPGQSKSYRVHVQVPANAQQPVSFIVDTVLVGPQAADSVRLIVDPRGQVITGLQVRPGVPPPNQVVQFGDRFVPLMHLNAQADITGNAVRLRSFLLRAQGTGDDAEDIQRIQIWRDDNGDFVPDQAQPLAEGHFLEDNGTLVLELQNQVLDPGESRGYLFTVDFVETPGGLPLMAVLLLMPLVGIRRTRLMALLLVFVLLPMAACRGGGGPGVQVSRTYQVLVEQVFAQDAQTGDPISVDIQGGVIQSATLTLQP